MSSVAARGRLSELEEEILSRLYNSRLALRVVDLELTFQRVVEFGEVEAGLEGLWEKGFLERWIGSGETKWMITHEGRVEIFRHFQEKAKSGEQAK